MWDIRLNQTGSDLIMGLICQKCILLSLLVREYRFSDNQELDRLQNYIMDQIVCFGDLFWFVSGKRDLYFQNLQLWGSKLHLCSIGRGCCSWQDQFHVMVNTCIQCPCLILKRNACMLTKCGCCTLKTEVTRMRVHKT